MLSFLVIGFVFGYPIYLIKLGCKKEYRRNHQNIYSLYKDKANNKDDLKTHDRNCYWFVMVVYYRRLFFAAVLIFLSANDTVSMYL